jgi:asparagine synthase (glutamine-hydrolysing)
LIDVIEQMLDDAPCYVMFSGGCDSSLVLAAALAACRRAGHSDPIPVTFRVAAAPATHEHEFQERVVAHLALHDRIVVELQADMLGQTATRALLQHGMVWPAPLLCQTPMLEQLDPGLVLSGEGGDEILGPRRVTPALAVARRVRRERRTTWSELHLAVSALCPRAVRRPTVVADITESYPTPWLSNELRQQLVERLVELYEAEPVPPARYPPYSLGLPWVRDAHENIRAFHVAYGLRWKAPLHDPSFLGSLCGTVAWHEYRGRTTLLRRYFSSLLPDEIIERRSKAVFNDAYFAAETRAFARRWDGAGVPDGVDGLWLKEHWTNASPIHGGTALLLHYAWLASEDEMTAQTSGPDVADTDR